MSTSKLLAFFRVTPESVEEKPKVFRYKDKSGKSQTITLPAPNKHPRTIVKGL